MEKSNVLVSSPISFLGLLLSKIYCPSIASERLTSGAIFGNTFEHLYINVCVKSMCTFVSSVYCLFHSLIIPKHLSNGSLEEHLPDLLKALLFSQQQPKQNSGLLGIEQSTSNLGLRVLAGEISSGDFAVHSTVRQHDGDVMLLNNVIDRRTEICGNTTCTLASNLLSN